MMKYNSGSIIERESYKPQSVTHGMFTTSILELGVYKSPKKKKKRE